MLTFLKKSRYILGINARNLYYIRPHNPRRAILIADNKLLAKKRLKRAGLPVLETYSIIKGYQDLDNFDWSSLPNSFTLKPNRGHGGEGILTVYGKSKRLLDTWIRADRGRVNIGDFKSHILTILEGGFSLWGLPDVAFFEERIKVLKIFKSYSYRGIPDIRLIVFNNVPVMAELRLPTKGSGGRANLHAGGIGVGIDLGNGITTQAIQHDRPISIYPDSKLPLRGIKISHWKEILSLATETQKVSGLGFLGVDIAIDRDKGPVILEYNARPGLSIQIANMTALADRLNRVAGLKIRTTQKGIRLAQDLFGGEIEQDVEEISGKKVIWIYEPIEIIDAQGNKYKTEAKIDTGAYFSSIDGSLAAQLGLTQEITRYKKAKSALGEEKRPLIEVSFILDGVPVHTEFSLADRSKLRYKVLIGRHDLKKFLIDPGKIMLKK